ncbi:class I SAM-dependent DNA methyltransferase [Methylococcus sp. EFPC2]|uniref:type I restriction-modification system subunit M n=1 Tax=Methylococcus sp. EFPC2 TaxID=2812648 RepID=UPI001966F116|nr:class I SAM-dependent DNA methyltransferase [Methylococcus sp. EFPC2]QSA98295.1 SAM-dependent DNA methyltransferase [Methylococcus sp. EFPC2]
MHWIAPSEKDTAAANLEKRLWDAADQFRANSGLKAQEYSGPILGLIFLRFADVRFSAQRSKLSLPSPSGTNPPGADLVGRSPPGGFRAGKPGNTGTGGEGAQLSRRGSRVDEPAAYHAEGVLYLSPEARFDYLLALPEAMDIGGQINAAMRDIEKQNPQLSGVLPKTYNLFTSTLLKELLKKVSEIPASVDYDAFGRIYEYFLGEFARTEGQKGGEFYTPSSIVKLLTEIIEPFHGRILDPACGSGGMFVQSARFVAERQKNPAAELAIHGVEKTDETGRLCRLNLAIHGLEGDIRHGGQVNSYYDDPHDAIGWFDFVLANPPFNVNAVDKERLKDQVGPGRRFPFALPRTDNANYLWIQLFYSSLNKQGRAGFVMANSASDARASEQDIRQKLIEARAVDVMVAVGPNLFYNVTLPCTLWFLDRGKANLPLPLGQIRRERIWSGEARPEGSGQESPETKGRGEGEVNHANTILFIDARHIYRQVDRAHRDWTPAQIGFIANLVRLYRGEALDYTLGGEEAEAKIKEVFSSRPLGEGPGVRAEAINASTASPQASGAQALTPTPLPQGEGLVYRDIPGLCKAATLSEVEAQGWSLNPGRYVGVAPGEDVSDEDFKEQLEELNEELEALNAQARELEQIIAANVAGILEA